MKRLIVLCFVLSGMAIAAFAQDRHELENMSVKVNALDFSKSRRIDSKKSGSRDYIYGESSAYLLDRKSVV